MGKIETNWDRDGSKQMRVSKRTYEVVAEMARRERRTMIEELAILVERGVAASTPEVMGADLTRGRTASGGRRG